MTLGQYHGWGVCGRWITREMAALTDVHLATEPLNLGDFTNELEMEFFRGATRRLGDISAHSPAPTRFPCPLFKTIQSAHMDPYAPNVRGTVTVGYCFYERDTLPAGALERAKRCYDRILTGSSWNLSPPSGLQFVAGGGLSHSNLDEYLASPCREFHFGRAARTPEETTAPVDSSKVRALASLVQSGVTGATRMA